MTRSPARAAFTKMTPLGQARDWLKVKAREAAGAICPLCGRFTKPRQGSINDKMAHSMIVMFVNFGTDWVHLPSQIGRDSAEESKLRYWGLLEQRPGKRKDGGAPGWWRLTPKGVAFVKGEITVAKHVYTYNRECLFIDESEQVSIRDALGTTFSYEELMRASAKLVDVS